MLVYKPVGVALVSALDALHMGHSLSDALYTSLATNLRMLKVASGLVIYEQMPIHGNTDTAHHS